MASATAGLPNQPPDAGDVRASCIGDEAGAVAVRIALLS